MKRVIKDYFTFSKKERIAIGVLLLLIACFIAMPYFYPARRKPPPVNPVLASYIARTARQVGDSMEEPAGSSYGSVGHKERTVVKKENFFFDPNTITQEDWQRLGLPAKTARTIINYRSKGGRFRSAADIHKIWGIKKEDADRLIPLVRMEEKETVRNDAPTKEETSVRPAGRKIVAIDINTATEEEWKMLPGIGVVLAKRILKFREHAGGFVSVDEVRKTYGLADSVYQRIHPYLRTDERSLPKLDLNLVSAYDLKRKLQVEDAVAKAVIVYRKQNGPYQSVVDLKKISLISDTLFARISPFLIIN
ncbi:helix-hairpin-helix domain-containing protein [Sediminibacterium roseum]|uniref:Helix-hairpin-helix domain-containing protein n=1 Tax=Sediminibacterium roseum TaxID=1978412 RepID=A0ABW9ZPC2_9BACT|nr:helix-hairpin-helix domain-containing protein [Sediminibacterium roseum]NCI48933.1 helix-hairpin-helix domain-containing protein [Sediminibacterium roseum]